MEDARAPNYELAEKDYMSGMKYKDIATKYNVTINTVKSWKTRYNWSKENKKGVHTKDKKVCTQKKVGAPIGNKNAVGNNGGAPERNKNAEKFGFFSKYLPEETKEIFNAIEDADPLELLWHQIQLAYTAIIRAQSIMNVTGKDEMIKELKKSKVKTVNRSTKQTSSDTNEEEFEYEFQFAWDRQATFIKAQTRAQTELRCMIKQYDDMLHKNWDIATEEQKAKLLLMQAQIDNINKDKDSGEGGVIIVNDIPKPN